MASGSVTIKDFKKDIPGKLSDDKHTYEFPVIQSKSSKGKETTWQIIVCVMYGDDSVVISDNYFDSSKQLPDGYYAITKVLSKQVNSAEYTKKTPTVIKEGKNIGKANQTNAFTQALRDALGKHNTQKRKSTTDVAVDGIERYPPMLVQLRGDKFIDFSKNIYLQRKFNGVRMVATLETRDEKPYVLLYSRNRKEYHGFKHIKNAIQPILEHFHNVLKRPLYLDGEAYKHGMLLQDISGIARKELSSETDEAKKLEYHVYDCFIPTEKDLTYTQRKAILDGIFKDFKTEQLDKYVKNVETFKVNNDDEINDLVEVFLAEGYEGGILRKGDKIYQYSYGGHHSDNLLKIKPVLEEEFEITGYTEGKKGKSKGALMFIVKTNEGKELPITPGETLEKRYKLFKEMSKIERNGKTHFENNYKGRFLTVQFDEWSKDRIPLRTRTDGIVIRDYE